MCSYNGLVPTDVPWSNVLLQCSYANDGCAYLVTVPHTYSSGQLVNCSFRAVTGAGVSPWAALPWKDVPASKARLITTPLVTPPFMHNFYGLPAAPATAGATQVTPPTRAHTRARTPTLHWRSSLELTTTCVCGWWWL